jgi:hypothetical protein
MSRHHVAANRRPEVQADRGAQKNLGPSSVVVIARKIWWEAGRKDIVIFHYRTTPRTIHSHTPPPGVILHNVLAVQESGGLAAVEKLNRKRPTALFSNRRAARHVSLPGVAPDSHPA